MTDVAKETQPDELTPEESTTEEEKDLNNHIRNTLATIEISGPESTHQEDQEPWAPLITPTQADPSYSSPLPLIKQLKDIMGSATIAITSTTTTTLATPAATTSRSGTGGTGGGTTSSGSIPNPDA